MQSRTSPPKRNSINQRYDNQKNFHRRSVHVSRLHNPIIPHHFDRATHKKPHIQENHLGNSLQQNTSSYTVIRRVNNPSYRDPYAKEEITQFPHDQSSSNSDPYGRTMDEIPKRYEYCMRRGVHNNDRSMPVSIQKKGKYYPQKQIKNYDTQIMRIGRKHPQRLQTLELQDSFQQQQNENHQTKQQIIPQKHYYPHNTQKKHKYKQQNIPRRRSTNDYLDTPTNFQQQYLVIKKSPKISSKNKHFIEYTPLSKESEDILQQIQRLYLNSQDQNVRIIRKKPSKNSNKQIQQAKRQSYRNSKNKFQSSFQQDYILENQIHLEQQMEARFKDIEQIMQIQNHNLQQHNQYLQNIIKKMQKKHKKSLQHIEQQNEQIKQLTQQRNAYMQRCLQLQHLHQNTNKQSINHYLQNSTISDTQNQTINFYQPKNYQKLDGLRKHFQGTIQQSNKQNAYKNAPYGTNKYHNIDPTPKFSSTRQSPQQVRIIAPKHEEVLFQEEGSQILNENAQKDQWTNANSGFSMVRNLSHNIPVDFYTKQVSEQQNSQSMSNQSEQKMARYNTQPPNTPLPLHSASQIDALNEQFEYLMKQYQNTRDVSIRKECVKITQKIKELKKNMENDEANGTLKPEGHKRGLKKMESLEMEIQQNKAKSGNKYQTDTFKFQN